MLESLVTNRARAGQVFGRQCRPLGVGELAACLAAGLMACAEDDTRSRANAATAQSTGGSTASPITPPEPGSEPATMAPAMMPPMGMEAPKETPTGAAGTAGSAMAGSSGQAMAGAMAGTAGMTAGAAGMAGAMAGGTGGTPGMMGDGACCADGDCLCHGDPPPTLSSDRGPYDTDSYAIAGTGCVYYPTDAEPPFAGVAVSDGFLGSGGCGSFQTGQWGPLYASWGIVAMIVNTGSGDQPATRGRALSEGIDAFKQENEDSGSPLYQKMSGRYGTSGFSMGGGGTTYAASDDPSLLTNVAIMPWGPVRGGVEVPSLVICGSSDGTAPCGSHGTPFYNSVEDSVPKMRITVSSGHNGQPSAGGGASGEAGLAFQKVFLEGDERWRELLLAVDTTDSTIQ